MLEKYSLKHRTLLCLCSFLLFNSINSGVVHVTLPPSGYAQMTWKYEDFFIYLIKTLHARILSIQQSKHSPYPTGHTDPFLEEVESKVL